MEPSVESLLERLRTESAVELLEAYDHPEYAGLWDEDPAGPRLYRGFAGALVQQGYPTTGLNLARRGLHKDLYPTDPHLRYLVALAYARGGSTSSAESVLGPLLTEALAAAPGAMPDALRVDVVALRGRLHKDHYHREPDPDRKRFPKGPYTIVIPPPNVTGALHMGHALNNTLQDVLIRWRRMQGYNALWMPGTDHAGIATQAVVERLVFAQEKKTRHDLGRDELVKRIWAWKDQYEARIITQLREMGASCDWRRTRFTLDPVCARAVRETFFRMFRDGYIYRGKRLVNWDTHLQTSVADDETYTEDTKSGFWTFKYPVAGTPDTFISFSTTRPEATRLHRHISMPFSL